MQGTAINQSMVTRERLIELDRKAEGLISHLDHSGCLDSIATQLAAYELRAAVAACLDSGGEREAAARQEVKRLLLEICEGAGVKVSEHGPFVWSCSDESARSKTQFSTEEEAARDAISVLKIPF